MRARSSNTERVSPHMGTVIPHLGTVIPHLGRVKPHLGTVIPHMGRVVPHTTNLTLTRTDTTRGALILTHAAPNSIFGLINRVFDYRSWATRAARRWKFNEIEIDANDANDANDSSTTSTDRIRANPKIEVLDILQEQLKDLRQEKDDSPREIEPTYGLTGDELINLVYQRYGRRYDMTFARREFLGQSFVSFNIMWQYLEQRSFPMSEDAYKEKIDNVAQTINAFGGSEVEKVRDALRIKDRKPKKVRHPKVGKAISVLLNVDQDTIETYFS